VTVRIALATCAAFPDLHEDDLPLVDALRAAGLDPAAEVWTDPSVDWSSYDGVLLRSIWDYHTRYDEFIGWLDLLDKGDVQVFNDTDLVRWNADKRYLLGLREQGVAIVPSQVAAGACLREVVAGLTGQEIVIKPTVSASAHHTIRGVAGSVELDQALAELPDAVYLVQPFQPEIVTDGECSLIYLGGTYSHAVVQRPAAGDYRVQFEYGGSVELVDPPTAVREAAEAALAAAPARTTPTYARVDGIIKSGRFLLMELELIEPYLFLPDHPPATDRLAAVAAERATIIA
jgi:glutathione synthase/RimK-type ligase-like ATP-grasp enzyme